MISSQPENTVGKFRRHGALAAGCAAALILFAALFIFMWRTGPSGGPETKEPREAPKADRGEASEIAEPTATDVREESTEEPAPEPRLVASLELPYGSGPGSVGLIDDPEQDIAGAESFAVRAGGVFLIADTVNQRLLRADAERGDVAEIDLPRDAVAADIAVDAHGRLLVFDYAGRIDWYGETGDRLGSLPVDMDRWEVRTGLRVVGDMLLMSDVDQRDHLLAVLEADGPRPPRPEELAEWDGEGFLTESGNRLTAGLERWQSGWVEVDRPDGSPQRFAVDAPGIVSLRVLGEDAAGNPHLQVERVENGRVVLEVHRHNRDGERTGLLRLPQNDYHHWTIRLLSMDANGWIYQALPGGDGFAMFIYSF